jgi:hypothetical protein
MPTHRFAVALRRIVVAACLTAIALPAAAERMEAPFELLYRADNQLVAGTVIEVNPGGRIVFERGDVLGGKGKPPEKIDVRVPLSTLANAKVGDRCIVGYSMSHADARAPTRQVINPDGAIVLASTGLAPALFRDTPETRALLRAGHSEHARESRAFFKLITQALQGTDPALQTLAAGEIALDPELAERLEDHGGAFVEAVARDAKTPPSVRTMLIESSSRQPAALGDWWKTASLDVVETTPIDGYASDTSGSAGLVLSALELLDSRQVTVPPAALGRWLRSAEPPLVERVCLMLRRGSPASERSAIDQALSAPETPARTRTFLADHLRRLDLLDAQAKARGERAGKP